VAIDFLYAQQLACHILDIDEENTNDEDFDELVENLLYERFGVHDMESFTKLLGALVPLIEIAESPLTHTLFKGFAHQGCWLLKIPVRGE